MFLFSRWLLVSIISGSIARATFSQDGNIVVVNGISYYAANNVTTTIRATAEQLHKSCEDAGAKLVPITVMETPSGAFTADVLQGLVKNYTVMDDVFNVGFLEGEPQIFNLLNNVLNEYHSYIPKGKQRLRRFRASFRSCCYYIRHQAGHVWEEEQDRKEKCHFLDL